MRSEDLEEVGEDLGKSLGEFIQYVKEDKNGEATRCISITVLSTAIITGTLAFVFSVL